MNAKNGGPQLAKLIDLTYEDEQLGYIDSTSNLRDDNVYLFSGKLDTVVDPSVVKVLEQYYGMFVEPDKIITNYMVEAEHCMPTLDYLEGEECSLLSSPYIGT